LCAHYKLNTTRSITYTPISHRLFPGYLGVRGAFESIAASRLPAHISDFRALESDHQDKFLITWTNAGFRTSMVVPLLYDDEIVGIITLSRKEVQPFTDKQISLFEDFAAEAAIA
jgi:GAF domain-containing protein